MFGKGAFAARTGHGHFGGFSAGCEGGPMGGPFAKMFGAKMGGGPGLLLSELNLSEEQLLRIAEIKGQTLAKVAHCVFRRTWPLLPAQNGPVVTGA